MPGLYNMIMGRNVALPILLGLVGIFKHNYKDFGRLRDAWIDEDASHIYVLHRNYGTSGIPFDNAAATLPTFVEKQLCEDDTYGWYKFSVPDTPAAGKILAQQLAEATDNTPCMDRYMQVIADLKSSTNTPEVQRARNVGIKIAQALTATLEDDEIRAVADGTGGVVITPIKDKGVV